MASNLDRAPEMLKTPTQSVWHKVVQISSSKVFFIMFSRTGLQTTSRGLDGPHAGPLPTSQWELYCIKIALCKWTTCSDLQRTVWPTTPRHAVWNVYSQRLSIHAPNMGVSPHCCESVLMYQTPPPGGFLRVPGRSRLIQRGPCCALILKDLSCTFAVPLSMMSSKSNCAQDAAGFEDTCFSYKSWHCWKNRERHSQSLLGNLEQWHCKHQKERCCHDLVGFCAPLVGWWLLWPRSIGSWPT